MTAIQNPFAGAPVGADFDWHTSHGYQGGTDYKVGPNQPIVAAADGTVYKLSESEIALDYGPSRFINYREVKTLIGHFPRKVKLDDPIGITGNEWGGIVRWPHIDRSVAGVRLEFEPAVNVHQAKPADSGTLVPILEGEEEMFQYIKKSGSRFFVHPSLPVRRISSTEWSANQAVGIRSERDVDNTKAERFRANHNANVKRLNPSLSEDFADSIVEAVLDGLNLGGDLATDVADTVYAKIAAGGVPLTKESIKQVAATTITELSSRLVR